MVELTNNQNNQEKHSNPRAKRGQARIDMTPMVDLGFLLLTFFVLTTQFTKPKSMEIAMPVDGPPTLINNAITILLSEEKNKMYYYSGKFEQDPSIIYTTDYSKDGIRKILIERNQDVVAKVDDLKQTLANNEIADTTYKRLMQSEEVKGKKDALYVIVKPDEITKYKNIIDIIDELNICDVEKYSLCDITPS